MERLKQLEEDFEAVESLDEFGEEKVWELFEIANSLISHMEWMKTKPRREDAKEIERLRNLLSEKGLG
jgi:tellurite resistance protein